jgi:hypothetical protein
MGLVGIAFAGNTPNAMQMQPIVAPQALAAASARAAASSWDQPHLQRLGVQPAALGGPVGDAVEPDGLPEASVKAIFARALPQATDRKDSSPSYENAAWVVVTRGAWMHSGPSVSAPITGHYSPSTELQMIGSQRGWFQVLDPETGERGWILARYYLEPIDAPGQKRVVARAEPVPVAAAAPAALAPSRPAPQAKRWVQASRLAPPDAPQPRAAPVRRVGQGVGAILARALQR